MFCVLDVDYRKNKIVVLDTKDDVVEVHPIGNAVSVVEQGRAKIEGITMYTAGAHITPVSVPISSRGEEHLPKEYLEVYRVRIDTNPSAECEVYYVVRCGGKTISNCYIMRVPASELMNSMIGMYFCSSTRIDYIDSTRGEQRVLQLCDGECCFGGTFPYTLPLAKGTCVGDFVTKMIRKGIGRTVVYAF